MRSDSIPGGSHNGHMSLDPQCLLSTSDKLFFPLTKAYLYDPDAIACRT